MNKRFKKGKSKICRGMRAWKTCADLLKLITQDQYY